VPVRRMALTIAPSECTVAAPTLPRVWFEPLGEAKKIVCWPTELRLRMKPVYIKSMRRTVYFSLLRLGSYPKPVRRLTWRSAPKVSNKQLLPRCGTVCRHQLDTVWHRGNATPLAGQLDKPTRRLSSGVWGHPAWRSRCSRQRAPATRQRLPRLRE
jgi:hypothetical protein